MTLSSGTTLTLRPASPHSDLSWIFYTEDAEGKIFRHVFRDNQGRQMAFRQRDFADMAPHIQAANNAMIRYGRGIDAELISQSHIIYNIAAGTFDFVSPNPDFSGSCRAAVRSHIENLNHVASGIRYYVAEEDPINPTPPTPRTTRPLLERLNENSRLKVTDFDKFVNAVKPDDAPIAHQLVNLKDSSSYKDIDWDAVKKDQEFILVTVAHKGHASTVVFDRQRNRAYYYDPAGKPITHPDRKKIKKLYDYLATSYRLNSGHIVSNTHNHQEGENVHCGRHVLALYNEILYYGALDGEQFRNFCTAHPDMHDIKGTLTEEYRFATT